MVFYSSRGKLCRATQIMKDGHVAAVFCKLCTLRCTKSSLAALSFD